MRLGPRSRLLLTLRPSAAPRVPVSGCGASRANRRHATLPSLLLGSWHRCSGQGRTRAVSANANEPRAQQPPSYNPVARPADTLCNVQPVWIGKGDSVGSEGWVDSIQAQRCGFLGLPRSDGALKLRCSEGVYAVGSLLPPWVLFQAIEACRRIGGGRGVESRNQSLGRGQGLSRRDGSAPYEGSVK